MRLFWRKKKKEWFNQKLIHAAKIQHLIHQSKIVINAVVIRSAVITFGVIGFAVIRSAVITFGVIRSAVIGLAVINRRLSSRSVVSSLPRFW